MINNMKIYVILLIVIFSDSTFANYYCSGRVTHFGADTRLSVSNGFGVHRLCDIDTDKCKVWSSIAMAAKMADREIVIYYSHSTIGGDQSGGAFSEVNYQAGEIKNLTAITSGILVNLDSGQPDNCEGTSYG